MEQLNPKDLDAGLQEIGLGDGSTEASVSRAKQMYQPSTNPLPMSGEFEKVDPNAIIIPENRIREKFDKKSLESLRESIRVRGLIHPPVVTRGQLALVAARLNAARWLESLPLARIWLLTPRPSMPPGDVIAVVRSLVAARRISVGFWSDRAHSGPPNVRWLHRDDP